MCNYQDEIKCCEHLCTSQDKVQKVQKGAEDICHVRLLKSRTFIASELAKELGTEGTMTTIKIKTLNGEERQEREVISGLKVTSWTGKNVWINLPVSYARENVPVVDDNIATPDQIKNWKYLERIADKIIRGKDISIGLLVGDNCSKALEPLEIIPRKDGGPYVFKTQLGWCIVGYIGEALSNTAASFNRTSFRT